MTVIGSPCVFSSNSAVAWLREGLSNSRVPDENAAPLRNRQRKTPSAILDRTVRFFQLV
jgi:hypothetical protein